MSNFPDAHKVYDLAAVFRERVIEQGRSFLWPDQEIWTAENAEAAINYFGEKQQNGDISINNIGTVAAAHSPATAMIAADAISARAICGVTNPTRFRKRLEQFYEGEGIPEPDTETFNRLLEAVTIQLPHSHTMWGGHAVSSMIGYINTFRALRNTGGFSGTDFARIGDIFAAAFDPEHPDTGWWAWDFLHVAYPDELIFATNSDRDRILKSFRHLGIYDDTTDRTEALKRIREYLAPGVNPRDFSFYDPEIMPLWEKDQKRVHNFRTWQGFPPLESSHEVQRTISPKFALAAQFRERVIENNGSFLWPDDEEVWTPENAHVALNMVKHLTGEKFNTGVEQLCEIAATAPRPVFQILCDSMAANFLGRKNKRSIAENLHRRILAAQDSSDVDQTVLSRLLDSADTSYPGVNLSNTSFINQYLIILHGITSIVAHPSTIGDRDAMVQQFWETNPLDHDTVMWFPFWSFIYLLYPEQFASVPGAMDRESVLRSYKHLTAGNTYPNYQAELADIRKQLDPDFDPYVFDFYAEPWRSQWSPQSSSRDAQAADSRNDGTTSPTIADLAAATHLDTTFLCEIKNLLTDKKQLIFEGPPGSGKTFVADKFARYFAKQPLVDPKPDPTSDASTPFSRVELIQFHQSYSYEDFVEGIRPDTNADGQLVYETRDGIFLEFARKAANDPDNNYVLIIDEINRGNVSRILGELMLLLEYRDKKARLPYSKQEFQIPPNLYIIGTMNSADRSLSQIDYALRRRFYFVPFMSVENGQAPVLTSWLQVHAPQSMAAVPLFVALNTRLRQHMGTDDLQVGHSYFMRPDIHTDAVQQQVWKYAVMPLLREYLYHHRDRDTLLQQYTLAALNPSNEPLGQDEAVDETQPEDV